jgi:plasmid stabilization system protein ParE
MIRLAPAAISDLERLRNFLYPENPRAAQRAMRAVWNKIELIERFPDMGHSTKAQDMRQTFVRSASGAM